MNKKTLLIASIALLIGGFVGYYFESVASDVKGGVGYSSLKQAESGISFDRCDGVQDSQKLACAEELVIQEALQTKDKSKCDLLSSEIRIDRCVAMFSRLERVQAEGASLCEGASNVGLCIDLVQYLFADSAQSRAECLKIESLDLERLCLNSVIPDIGQSSVPARPADLSGFGPQCFDGDSLCLSSRQTAIEAITTADLALCDTSGQFVELCKRELALYQAVSADSLQAYCAQYPQEVTIVAGQPSTVFTEFQCLNSALLAKALDGDATACSLLPDQNLVANCLETAGGGAQDRFGYLQG